MKNRISLLAFVLILTSATAFAQRNNDYNNNNKDRNGYTHNEYNDSRDRGGQPDYSPRRVRYNDDRTAMRPGAFRIFIDQIRNESFDSDRMRIAQYVVRNHNLSTAQIRTVAQLFSFDSYKLEFTKYAYASCIDPQNYYVLGRVFAFSSSRRELFDYIARV